MDGRVLRVAILALGVALSMGASKVVLGPSDALLCYEFAHYDDSRDSVDLCTRAIREQLIGRIDLAATYANRGVIRARRRHYERALDDYDDALRLNPLLLNAWINRGNVLVRMKRYDEAQKDYDKAVEMSDGQSALVFYNRGIAHEKQGNKARARRDYLRAVELEPDTRRYRDALESTEFE
ncbi:MAG: tetratricopeptide repeat protein [Pseudomonadales bacterium]